MTYVTQSPARTSGPSLASLLTLLQISFLSGYGTFIRWREQRTLLRELESMPFAMRKDLGWPAIDTKQQPLHTRG